jgi:glyoxylase-like metal-dependent hydrolase (beta-lactamase superfamily II)
MQSTFWMTNTGLITGADGSVVLVDPGVLPDELAEIARRAGKGRLRAAISTHEDWDHVLWSRDLPARIPRLALPETVRMLEMQRDEVLRSLAREEASLGVRWEHDLVGRLDPVETNPLVLGNMRITLVPTPGHTMGHASLWLEDDGVLFAGDMLSDVDIPMLAPVPGVARIYLRSLETLEAHLHAAMMIVPGHGTPCGREEARSRLDADRAYMESLIAWSDDGVPEPPNLNSLLPGDPRVLRHENIDAHRQNAAAITL